MGALTNSLWAMCTPAFSILFSLRPENGQEQTNQTESEKEGMNNENRLDNNVDNYASIVTHNVTEPTKGTNKGIRF